MAHMTSYLRDGADMFPCKRCGETFDLNSSARKRMEYSSFSPLCHRCVGVLAQQEGMVRCTMCAQPVDIDTAQTVTHMHPTGEKDELNICSQACTVLFVSSGREVDWHGDGT